MSACSWITPAALTKHVSSGPFVSFRNARRALPSAFSTARCQALFQPTGLSSRAGRAQTDTCEGAHRLHVDSHNYGARASCKLSGDHLTPAAWTDTPLRPSTSSRHLARPICRTRPHDAPWMQPRRAHDAVGLFTHPNTHREGARAFYAPGHAHRSTTRVVLASLRKPNSSSSCSNCVRIVAIA